MPSNWLEQLVAEWYEYRGYFIRRNVLVGKRPKGGYECELDVVAFHPNEKHLVQVECSSDASSWEEREERFRKKFEAGQKHVPDLFLGVAPAGAPIEQIAVLLYASTGGRAALAGGRVLPVAALVQEIVAHFEGRPTTTAVVSEQYALLRMLQFVSDYREDVFQRTS